LPFVNIDDDRPGLDIVIPSGGLQTTENGMGTATFTVALKSRPTATVTIAVSSNNTDEGKVTSPATLTFTSSGNNWSSPQMVVITGQQDQVADGPQLYQVKLANAVSTDGNYNGKFATQVDVTNIDDDQPGYIVSADPALQTTEKGGKATFNVSLKSKPPGTTTVSLGLSSSNPKEGTVSPSSLSFSAADWDKPDLHPVTITGIDDKKADGDVGYQITFTPDAAYGAPAPTPVPVTNLDDDVIGVTVTPLTCSTTPTTTATFSVRLTSQPSASVTIPLASDSPLVGSASPESLTFTTATGVLGGWDTAQTVTVTGLDDGSMGVPKAYNIVTGSASAPGETTGYNGYMTIDDVSCTNTTPPPATP